MARNIRSEILQGVDAASLTREKWSDSPASRATASAISSARSPVSPRSPARSLSAARSVTPSDPVSSKNHGIIYLPGDRHAEGVLLTLSVRENLTLLVLKTLARFGFVSRTREIEMVDHYVDTLGIKTPSREATIANLSGRQSAEGVVRALDGGRAGDFSGR